MRNNSLYALRKICDNAQKMKFFNKDFFSKCDQIRRFLRIWRQKSADLVTFTEDILNGKLQFLCAVQEYGFSLILHRDIIYNSLVIREK